MSNIIYSVVKSQIFLKASPPKYPTTR